MSFKWHRIAYIVDDMPFIDFFGAPMKNIREPEFFSTQVTQARRFYIQKTASKASRLNVVCGGCEQTAPDFEIDRKSFPYYSIEFVAKGKGTAILAGRTFELSPGIVFSYGPNISQKIIADPQAPMLKYFIDFTGSSATQMLSQYVAAPGTAVRISRLNELSRILDDLIGHGLSDSRFKSTICSTLLEYLLLRIAETIAAEEAMPGQAFLNYQRCRQYIKDNFVELTSLEAIAEACSVDHAYLCRLFKRFDTQSPYQYLIQLKMAYAAQLLHKPGLFVKEIAYRLGFEDPSHFTRTFTRVFGIPPQTFKGLR
jgi:AraC-like DNA-binding protein